jgi:RHS repeat-associated protein
VDGERIARCRKAGGGEEFTFYLRDEGGHVLTEFRADYCPEPQTGFSGFALAATYLQEDFSYFGGKLTASSRINNFASDACPQWAFYHADHLGNPRLITDESRRITATHTYWPFGEEITAQGQDDLTHKYTGHERDFESNLDYMHARYYNNFLGRFLSVDRGKPNPENPQTWNKYKYARNNPIIFIDDNGLWDTIFYVKTTSSNMSFNLPSGWNVNKTSSMLGFGPSKGARLGAFSSAGAKDIAIYQGHGNVKGIGSSESNFIQWGELAKAVGESKPTVAILAACQSMAGAESLTNAGVKAVFGFGPKQDVQTTERQGTVEAGAAAAAGQAAANTLMAGGTLQQALDAGQKAFVEAQTDKQVLEQTEFQVKAEDLQKTLDDLVSLSAGTQ